MMAFLKYTLLSILISSACEVVESQRNLEADIDDLKLAFDNMKSLHESEIRTLKEIIQSQGKEIEKLKENYQLDIRKMRQEMDRCWSSHQDKNEAAADPVIDTEPKKNPGTLDINHNTRRSDVPVLPYRKDIGDGNQRVAFYANLSHDLVNIRTNQVIEFDRAVTNVGNLYNNTTGVFYCDLPGTYVFHIHILANPHQTVYSVLTKNGEKVSYIYVASTDDTFSHGGNTAILELKRGDTIAVRLDDQFSSSGNVIHETWSSFSGFLLYPAEESETDFSVVG